jgi:hypothetical protein
LGTVAKPACGFIQRKVKRRSKETEEKRRKLSKTKKF